MRNPFRRCYPVVAAVILFSATTSQADAPDNAVETGHLVIAAGEAPQVVFDWNTQRCSTTDTPDAPPRAFRDYLGRVHLIATHANNRALIGPDFSTLSHPCAIIYQGDHDDDPAKFDDRQWLTSFSTTDGRNIFALVHNEFQGNLRPWLCPSRKYLSCWYNAITYAVSTDGGTTFHRPSDGPDVIAAPSVPYVPDAGRPIGHFQPTNIVRKDGDDFSCFSRPKPGRRPGAFVSRDGRPEPIRGIGLPGMETDSIRGLSAPMPIPRLPSTPTCSPVGKGQLFEIGSLTYDRVAGVFVLSEASLQDETMASVRLAPMSPPPATSSLVSSDPPVPGRG